MGQNLGHDQDSWDAMIQFWFDEYKIYDGYGGSRQEEVQHYKQVNPFWNKYVYLL